MNALLLVDIQNDFLPGGRLAVPEGDAVVGVANRLMGAHALVVGTLDWHPPGHESFASAHEGRDPGEVVDLHGLDQVLWPDHCVRWTGGAALAPGLDSSRIRRLFTKAPTPVSTATLASGTTGADTTRAWRPGSGGGASRR